MVSVESYSSSMHVVLEFDKPTIGLCGRNRMRCRRARRCFALDVEQQHIRRLVVYRTCIMAELTEQSSRLDNNDLQYKA
jgi:hypothetical protein